MIGEEGRKVLFVFSDPGGAKPCLALMNEREAGASSLAISDRYHSFYKDFDFNIQIICSSHVETLLETYQPELVFTGTSYKSNIERHAIEVALKKKIKCYSFVDHWTSISNRFTDVSGRRCLPDQIWVIDDKAKRIAISEGIEPSRILISGNPYHRWLSNWKPTCSKAEFLSMHGLAEMKSKILLYAPDPLSNVSGVTNFGFDEIGTTATIVELFEKHRHELGDWMVLLKCHPNQDTSRLKALLPVRGGFVLIGPETDVNLCLHYCDAVMGFFSSILLEAKILNKPALRFLPVGYKSDPFSDTSVGVIVNQQSLVKVLHKIHEPII